MAAFPEIALDTNVLARYLLGDSPDEAKRAEALLCRRARFHVTPTVLIELGWVLKVNGCTGGEIGRAVEHLMQLPGFESLAAPQTRYALDWLAKGLDWADAVHLAHAPQTAEMFTFDKAFVKVARKTGAFPAVRQVP